MKVFSLYHRNKFVASFPSRDAAIYYGKLNGGDPWDYDIIEEYLNKTPYQMYTPPYTSLTPYQTIPCKPGLDLDTGITLIPDGETHTNSDTPQLNKNIDLEMNSMNPRWRVKWCNAGACGCMGCANVSGGLVSKGYTYEDWRDWIKRNPGAYEDSFPKSVWGMEGK